MQSPNDRVRNALFWVITQRVVAITYRRFGTTYRYNFQGGRESKSFGFCVDSLTLKMVPKSGPETSVRNFHCSLRNDPEERSSQLLRGGSLKSRAVTIGFKV